tara:strand:+ start:38529 stop:39023 length:495 start_codon:yes stop_codon:yes gene_type:complete
MNGMDDDDVLTAYHEAGHAAIGYALGARIESVQLGGDDDLPARFGDCRVNWGPVDDACDWQRMREVMTVLAGPVAEMIYRGEPLHPAHYGPWQDDWRLAWSCAERLAADPRQRTRLLERVVVDLHARIQCQPCWAAIAAVADELQAHEFLDEEQLSDALGFWIG